MNTLHLEVNWCTTFCHSYVAMRSSWLQRIRDTYLHFSGEWLRFRSQQQQARRLLRQRQELPLQLQKWKYQEYRLIHRADEEKKALLVPALFITLPGSVYTLPFLLKWRPTLFPDLLLSQNQQVRLYIVFRRN